MLDYNKESEKVNRDFNGTYWQTLGVEAMDAPAARSIAARNDAQQGAKTVSPPSPNRGGVKYGGISDKSLSSMDLDFIHPSSGLDYLCYGIFGYWRAPHILEIIKQYKDDGKNCLNLNGFEFELLPGGLRDGMFYDYVLIFHGVKILINAAPSGTIAPIRVHVPGLVLLQCDWRAVVADIFDVLERIGFAWERTTVSRADLQVTLKIPFGTVAVDMLCTKRVVTDCRGDLVHYRQLTTGDASTVWYRSRTIQLCAYNKTLEMQLGKAGADYTNVWNRMYGEPVEPLSRVEFRLRSDALRRWGITSLEDLEDLLPSVVERLTNVWFRVLKSPKVRGHEAGAKLSPIWSKVRAAFLRTFDGSVKQIVPVRRLKSADPIQLIQQARGCMAAAVPFLARSPASSDLKDAFDDLTRLIKSGLDEKIQERCRQFFRRAT